MNNDFFPFMPTIRQTGAALITGLIFLVVLSMIGVTAARMSTLEERMSGNMRDRAKAMHAAEMALRDAEMDIRGQGTGQRSPPISGMTGFAANCNQDTTNNTSDDGLCDRRGALPTYTNTSINFPAFVVGATNYAALSVNISAAPGVTYGRFTGATPIPLVSAQPRYVIEGIPKKVDSDDVYFYRVTVRAQGASPNTVVWQQELFRP